MERAPIQTNTIVMPEFRTEDDKRPRTRCGYLVPEAYSCYEKAIGEVGATASGKALHFAADLICSGGLDIWIRGAYSYALQHIGLANPRIFVYLRQRIQELDAKSKTLMQESFYSNSEVQAAVAETVLILQICPKKSKVAWPKVDDNTKHPGWIRTVASAPETKATRTVWDGTSDQPALYLASNELCKAIEDGASERALFWIRWTLEEDARIRKDTKNHGLTNKERGPATGGAAKTRTEAGHYLAALLFEIYKDLSTKGLLRMNEEVAELIRLWRGGEMRMPSRFRRDCLALLTMICCEVPRWKVPAAPTLVPDPIKLSRAVAQAPAFFREVLSYRALPAGKELKPNMTKAKVARQKVLTEKDFKKMSVEEHLKAYDEAMEAFLNKG
jgi:hypothetical protein